MISVCNIFVAHPPRDFEIWPSLRSERRVENTSGFFVIYIRLEGPEDPHRTNSRFLRSRDPAHASLPLAQTPWGLTGRAWLQAGAQQVAIVVSHN